MKKTIAWLSAALVAAAVCPFGVSAASVKTAEVYKGTPVIDSEMDDIWKTAKEYTVDTTPVIRDQTLDPDTEWNPRNVKGTFRLLWDEKNLYIYAVIDDPYVKDAMDRFNVFVSPTNNKKEYQVTDPSLIGQYDKNAPVAYAATDVFVKLERNRISASGPDGTIIPKGCYDQIKSGIKQKRKTKAGDKQGWIVEACIPWAPGVSVKQGQTIGFDCEIDDQDTMENGRGIVVWNQPNEEAWCNPSQTGLAVLKGAGDEQKPVVTTTKAGTTTTSSKKATTQKPVNGGTTAKPDTGKTDPTASGATDPSVNENSGIPDGTTTAQSAESSGATAPASSDISTQGETGGVSPWLWVGIVAAVVVLAGGGTGLYFYLKKKKSM